MEARIHLRRARPEDAPSLERLQEAAVRQLNRADYSPGQLEAFLGSLGTIGGGVLQNHIDEVNAKADDTATTAVGNRGIEPEASVAASPSGGTTTTVSISSSAMRVRASVSKVSAAACSPSPERGRG